MMHCSMRDFLDDRWCSKQYCISATIFILFSKKQHLRSVAGPSYSSTAMFYSCFVSKANSSNGATVAIFIRSSHGPLFAYQWSCSRSKRSLRMSDTPRDRIRAVSGNLQDPDLSYIEAENHTCSLTVSMASLMHRLRTSYI